jgi:eukaryotic-like serine/threonine-protein kinase
MMPADQQDEAPAMELPAGSRFGNYDIVRKLGEGGMGAVYEARRQGLNKRVALKILTLGGNPAVTARFVQEARISAGLEHPHVADCFDVGEVEGVPFLALEFLDGETLGARMDRGPMGITEVVDVALPVCSALRLAHEQGIVHRDLKPDNIFLARQVGAVVPKVLDFGIAKAHAGSSHQGLTRTASIMGTPGYMSPEQAKDSKNVGPATDQFALGVILWEAVAGRGLFLGESSIEVMMQVVSTPAPPLRQVLPTVDERFEAVVTRLLDKDPARRLSSMREVGASLLPFASPDLRARWSAEFAGAPPHPATAMLSDPRPSNAPSLPTIRDAAPPMHLDAMPAPSLVTAPAPSTRKGLWVLAGLGFAALLLLLGVAFAMRATTPTAEVIAPPLQGASPVAPTAAPAPPPPPPTPAAPTPAPHATAHPSPPRPPPVVEAPPHPGRRGRPAGHPPRGGRRRRPID